MKKVITGLTFGALLAISTTTGYASASENQTEDTLEPITQDQIVTMGAGAWDPWAFNPEELYVTPGYERTFSTILSGGGDYKVRLNANHTGSSYVRITLWSDDDGSYRKVGTANLSTGQEAVFDVRSFVDGSNNKAELFVNVYSPSGSKGLVSLSYWD